MKLDANKLALSFGAAAALLWTVCSVFVALLPELMMTMTGHMLHAETEALDWTLTWGGFFVGLVSWAIWSAIAGWLVGWLYNRM